MQKVNLNRILQEIELEYVKKALEFTGNNITDAAELLGLKRTALSMRLPALGITIQRPPKRKIAKTKDTQQYFADHPNNIENQLWNE